MAISILHLCSRNIGSTMQPTISRSKISLSSSPLSFSHSPSLWCPTLACISLSNQIKHCKLESRSTMIVALDKAGNRKRKNNEGTKDVLSEGVSGFIEEVWDVGEGNNSGSLPKKPKLKGEHPASAQQECKDGVTVATGDLSVNVGLEIKGDGAYLLKMERIIQSSNHDGSEEDEVERAKKMAQNAALLLLHAKMLQEMGQKLFNQSRASLRSMFRKSDS